MIRAHPRTPPPGAPPPAPLAASGGDRIAALDVVRGLAVMGILLLNIVDFAMPGYAYVDPHFYGGATGANIWTWRIVYVLFDGKMRGLFTMLFGASTCLIADRAAARGAAPWRVHYARMGSLLLFGIAHAYLIWSGDILVAYALCGALLFLARSWPTSALWYAAVALLLAKLVLGILTYGDARTFEAAAAAPGASAALRAQWRVFADQLAPSASTIAPILAAYRGSYADAWGMRAEAAWSTETVAGVQAFPDTLALMLMGMALYRSGFLLGRSTPRTYGRVALWSFAICVPLYGPIVALIERTHFSPITLTLTEAVHLTLLRPFLTLGWASLAILWARSGRWSALTARIGAVGRAAFSNYLGTSIVCTLLFNGYGLGWYGHLERWQCYGVVAAIWTLMLLWSKPWLDRFAYGPFEWVWRSMAQGHVVPVRKPIAT